MLRRRGAFTFIEILVVLVIMTLLSATAMSRYSGAINNFGADALVRRLAADLNYAQSIARRTGTAQVVTFDATAGTYQLVGLTDPDKPGVNYTVACASEPYRGKIVSIALTAGASSVTQVSFDAYGFPDAGGTVVVRVGDAQRTLTLTSASGKTSVQ